MAIEKIAVVGCGQVALGIAESAATHGVQVIVVKPTAGGLEALHSELAQRFERRVARGKLGREESRHAMARIELSDDLAQLGHAELVIESVTEEPTAKAELLARIEPHVSPEAILAINSSSLRLADVARSLRRPERLVALHFFSPVPAMSLVEVSASADSSPHARELATELCMRLGKTPVQVQDSAGLVVDRLLVPSLLHAIETLEQGVATAESIDVAMKLGCGHPMGPLALADLIGLDVLFVAAKTLHYELRDSRYRAPSLLRRLVLAGHLGRKTARGIYDYTDVDHPTINGAIQIEPAVATGT